MGFFDIIWYILMVFLMVAWFWVVISVVTDIFRSSDMNGFSKALWVLFVIVIPWLGVLAYLLVRGDKMQAHQAEALAKMEAAQKQYIRDAAGAVSVADELEKLSGLKDKGVLTEEEFAAQKAKLMAG
ncbi:MAG: SHOCT domain-containing protein [Rhodobacteraceae bacterium]|nr:SHOCT domain-containing protein [Paracoccaceae bacterium]